MHELLDIPGLQRTAMVKGKIANHDSGLWEIRMAECDENAQGAMKRRSHGMKGARPSVRRPGLRSRAHGPDRRRAGSWPP
jgi:hypothetical protein